MEGKYLVSRSNVAPPRLYSERSEHKSFIWEGDELLSQASSLACGTGANVNELRRKAVPFLFPGNAWTVTVPVTFLVL